MLRLHLPLVTLVLLTLACATLAQAQATADELRLRDGRTVRGRAVEFDGNLIVMRTDAGLATFQRADCAMILFGGAAAPAGQLPAGISAGPGLTVRRWATWRQISAWGPDRTPDHPWAWGLRMCADGSRIILWSDHGLFAINADGTGFTRIAAGTVHYADISADGRRVAYWVAEKAGLYTANSDGTNVQLMPGGYEIASLRMTADGRRVCILVPGRGLLWVMADGSDIRSIVTTADVARVAGLDNNGNLWARGGVGVDGSGIDMSDDGSRIVCQFGQHGIALNGDGTGLRKLVDMGNDVSLARMRISNDGRRVAYSCSPNAKPQLGFLDWDGGNRVINTMPQASELAWFQLTRDGRQAVGGHGVRYFGDDGKTFYEPFVAPGLAEPLDGAHRTSCAADGRRGCFIISGVRAKMELVVYDLNPPTLNGAPGLADITVMPRFILTDGTTRAMLTTRPGGGDNIQVWHALMRDGLSQFPEIGGLQYGLNNVVSDKGNLGDEKADDGIYTSDQVRLNYFYGKHAAPGPLTLRLVTWNRANCGLSLDIEGMEARTP